MTTNEVEQVSYEELKDALKDLLAKSQTIGLAFAVVRGHRIDDDKEYKSFQDSHIAAQKLLRRASVVAPVVSGSADIFKKEYECEPLEPIKCPECIDRFYDQQELDRHIKQRHLR